MDAKITRGKPEPKGYTMHKGYAIRYNATDAMRYVSKDGKHLFAVQTLEMAIRWIDRQPA